MSVFSDGELLDPGQPLYNGERLGRTFDGELLLGAAADVTTYYYRVGSAAAVATTDPASVPSNGVVVRTTCGAA